MGFLKKTGSIETPISLVGPGHSTAAPSLSATERDSRRQPLVPCPSYRPPSPRGSNSLRAFSPPSFFVVSSPQLGQAFGLASSPRRLAHTRSGFIKLVTLATHWCHPGVSPSAHFAPLSPLSCVHAGTPLAHSMAMETGWLPYFSGENREKFLTYFLIHRRP
jgi:hypothetical protein